MGCFSFMCQGCDTAINSSSLEGEECILFLLKKGKVIHKMEGDYDSYGRVFIDDTQRKDVQHDLRESQEWSDPFPEQPKKNSYDDNWGRVCSLMSAHAYGLVKTKKAAEAYGMAAFHTKCYKGVEPTTKSEQDPNQGWGSIREKFTKRKSKE